MATEPGGAAAFTGRWVLTRRIDDRQGGQTGRFDGVALFAPVHGGLAYVENGSLRLGAGPELRAERRYLWQFEGAAVSVAFHDGRPFHRFDLRAGAQGEVAARHLCGTDVYDVVYDFSGWPEWRAVWTVTGPAKDYTMTSDYCRVAGAAQMR